MQRLRDLVRVQPEPEGYGGHKDDHQYQVEDEEDLADYIEAIEGKRLLRQHNSYGPRTHCAGEGSPAEMAQSLRGPLREA